MQLRGWIWAIGALGLCYAAFAQGVGTVIEEGPPPPRRMEPLPPPPPPPPPPSRFHHRLRVPPPSVPGMAAPGAMQYVNGPFVLMLFRQAIRGDQAPMICQQAGMRIASVTNWRENMMIAQLLAEVPSEMWPPATWRGAWIGLRGGPAGWRWLDGRPFTFHAFGQASGEPRGDGPFVAIELARAGNPDGWWNDAPATESYAGVVCRR